MEVLLLNALTLGVLILLSVQKVNALQNGEMNGKLDDQSIPIIPNPLRIVLKKNMEYNYQHFKATNVYILSINDLNNDLNQEKCKYISLRSSSKRHFVCIWVDLNGENIPDIEVRCTSIQKREHTLHHLLRNLVFILVVHAYTLGLSINITNDNAITKFTSIHVGLGTELVVNLHQIKLLKYIDHADQKNIKFLPIVYLTIAVLITGIMIGTFWFLIVRKFTVKQASVSSDIEVQASHNNFTKGDEPNSFPNNNQEDLPGKDAVFDDKLTEEERDALFLKNWTEPRSVEDFRKRNCELWQQTIANACVQEFEDILRDKLKPKCEELETQGHDLQEIENKISDHKTELKNQVQHCVKVWQTSPRCPSILHMRNAILDVHESQLLTHFNLEPESKE